MLIYVLKAMINQQALLAWTGSAQAWKLAFLRFLYKPDLSRGYWGRSLWARKISKVTTMTSLEKRVICYQVVCYSPFRVGLQGGYCHWGLLTARQHCNLVKRKLCATSVLLRRARKCLFLRVFQKPEKVSHTQDGCVGSCPLSCLPGWHKTERKRRCIAHDFCRNTWFWGVLQQRGFLPWNTQNAPSFLEAGRATWRITPRPLRI